MVHDHHFAAFTAPQLHDACNLFLPSTPSISLAYFSKAERKAMHKFCTCHPQVSMQEAERRIKEIKEPYKLEILESIAARHPDAPITIYHLGREGEGEHWWDLCAGPHVQTTKDLNPAAVDLESLAGLTSFIPLPPPPYLCSTLCIAFQVSSCCWAGSFQHLLGGPQELSMHCHST